MKMGQSPIIMHKENTMKIKSTSIQQNKKIFQDLEEYLVFCKQYGYFYDERDLYSSRSYEYRQYQKCCQEKHVRNMWEQDSRG